MKRLPFLGLIMLIVFCVALSSCNTSTTTSSNTSKDTPLTLSDRGNIRVDGRGYFNYQRLVTPLTGSTTFQGVTFAPYAPGPGTTITAPVGYWFTVTFADGSSEELQKVGLANTNNIDINITQHNNPGAGVMLIWQDINGRLTPFLYLMVSE